MIDTGIGISPENKQRIFAPFTQADASTTRVFGGSGLGLAICVELISKFGGKLNVNSEIGKGSEFFFTVTFDKAKAPRDLASKRRSRLELLREKRVMIVDDNGTNRSLVEAMLRHMSIFTDSVHDGDAALKRLRLAAEAGAPYDIVLVDALMPGKDGFEFIEELNKDEQLAPTTVLMLSSTDRSTFNERAKRLQVDGFLDKPVSRRDLLEALRVAAFGMDALSDTNAGAAVGPTPLNVLVAEDTPANQKVVFAILKKRGHNVSLANNGREAIDKVQTHPFDVVLMDVQMPTVDGYQATAVIRKLRESSVASIPIIAMTAHAMKGDAEKCIKVGMNDYISKPIESRRLVQLVEYWGGTKGLNARSTSKEEATLLDTPDRSTANVADFEAALARLDGNRKLLVDMIGFFREDVPQLLESLDAGVSSGDATQIKRAAHSIKGLAAGFDAGRVVHHALRIEQFAVKETLDQIVHVLPDLRAGIAELEDAFTEFVGS